MPLCIFAVVVVVEIMQCEREICILNLHIIMLPVPPFYFHSFILFGLTCISKQTMIIPSPQVTCGTDILGTNETRLVNHFVCTCQATVIAAFACCCKH